MTVVENKAGSGLPTVSKYDYGQGDGYDALGRRTSVVMTGPAFGNGHHNDYGYNDRSELTAADRKTGTTPGQGTAMTPGDWDYVYDHIGNRKDHTAGTASAVYYCANDLNQYTFIDDAAGTCPTPPTPTDAFDYDADGNLTGDGVYQYVWDAENRLVAVAPAGTPGSGDKLLAFKYDYMGRRVEKTYAIHDGQQWVTESVQRFVYDDWNVVMVLDENNDVVRKYTWGLDLSRTVHGAGGIGGLLAAVETQGTVTTADDEAFWLFYDANGNVGQIIKASDQSLAAKYEYDPYGNIVGPDDDADGEWQDDAGPYASANPIRFSTKWFDTELAGTSTNGAVGTCGLGYWGYRYYSPSLGRWISRDQVEEAGGKNIYVCAANRLTGLLDMLGLSIIDCNCNGLMTCLLVRCARPGVPALPFCTTACNVCRTLPSVYNPGCVSCAMCVVGAAICGASCVVDNCSFSAPPPPPPPPPSPPPPPGPCPLGQCKCKAGKIGPGFCTTKSDCDEIGGVCG